MNKYTVRVEEVVTTTFTIEAKDEDAARSEGLNMFLGGALPEDHYVAIDEREVGVAPC